MAPEISTPDPSGEFLNEKKALGLPMKVTGFSEVPRTINFPCTQIAEGRPEQSSTTPGSMVSVALAATSTVDESLYGLPAEVRVVFADISPPIVEFALAGVPMPENTRKDAITPKETLLETFLTAANYQVVLSFIVKRN